MLMWEVNIKYSFSNISNKISFQDTSYISYQKIIKGNQKETLHPRASIFSPDFWSLTLQKWDYMLILEAYKIFSFSLSYFRDRNEFLDLLLLVRKLKETKNPLWSKYG